MFSIIPRFRNFRYFFPLLPLLLLLSSATSATSATFLRYFRYFRYFPPLLPLLPLELQIQIRSQCKGTRNGDIKESISCTMAREYSYLGRKSTLSLANLHGTLWGKQQSISAAPRCDSPPCPS